MRRELLIAAGSGEWRAVWLEDGEAVELHVERGDSPPPGSLHLGRVVRGIGGLGAALVDIGGQRPGFLPPRRPLAEGAAVIVRVQREAQRDKGALLAEHSADERAAALAARLDPPAQLAPAAGFAAALALRLPAAPQCVLVDDPAPLPEVRGVFPGAAIARSDPAEWPVDVDALFDAALAPSIALADGGSIHIAETPAATLIDVDTGSPERGTLEQNATTANLAAAATIAREIRRRRLGGGIVVDFAALDGGRRRERVRRAIAAALAGDPAGPQVLGWTRLGHLEIVRPRRLRSLGDLMLEPQGARKTALTLAFECLRAAANEARARPGASWRLVVAPEVAAALRGPAAAGLSALEARLGRRFAIDAAGPGAARLFDIAPR